MIDGYATETRAGDQGPVVVRTATTEVARRQLRQEADRLGCSRHPGVVVLLNATDDELTTAWAGAQTLELMAAPLPGLCGVLASVASTIADLHEIGIIHGRLDASHVVIDVDGRPRLCGMRGPAPGERTPLPTDDVAAIGALIDHLIGPDTEIEPIPERRWSRRRWTGYQRRALQLVADRALQDDPALRPTARELAAAITEAVPGAELVAPPASPAAGLGFAPEPMAPPNATVRADVPDPITDGHQVSPAPAEADSDPETSTADDEPSPPPLPPPPPPAPPAVEVAAPQPAESPTSGPVGALPAVPPPPTFLGLRVEAPPPPSGLQDSADGDPVEPPRRRPQTDAAATSPIHRRPLMVAMAAVIMIALAALAFAPKVTGHDPTPDLASLVTTQPTTSSPASPSPRPGAKPASVPDQPDCPPRTPSTGPDLDGDGCPEIVEIDGTRVVADGVSFDVGEQGDQVEVADWNCDGHATAAVVRPGTGEIFVFSGWLTAAGPVSVTPVTVVPGAVALVEPNDGPCSTHHRVRMVGGAITPVDLRVPEP